VAAAALLDQGRRKPDWRVAQILFDVEKTYSECNALQKESRILLNHFHEEEVDFTEGMSRG
jgi:hypothetical protein